MPGLEVSLTFFMTAIILAIAPGPDNIFVLTQSALYGSRAGMLTTLGLSTGLVLQTLAVALGIAVLFHTWPWAFVMLKCAGAAYLCWLAWLSFRQGPDHTGKMDKGSFPGYAALYGRGVIMNVTNPKVCIFFLAFLPQFCNPGLGNPGLQTIFFGLLFILATIVVFFTVAFLGGRLAGWFNKSVRMQIYINKLAALVYLGLAIALVFMES